MRAIERSDQTRFVSFSGIDGAGKSTQILRFRAKMEQAGLRCSLVSFWDDVARFRGLREGASHVIFKGDRGVGTPSAPIMRRDTCPLMDDEHDSSLIYFADAVSTRSLMKRLTRSNANVVIFDRFIYDELANLNYGNAVIRAYARMIARFIPKPNISFLLDADPAEARARKPEYPLDFLQFCRSSYFALSDLIGSMTVIPPLPADEVEREIVSRAESALFIAPTRGVDDQGQYLVESAR